MCFRPRSGVKFARNRCTQYQMRSLRVVDRCEKGTATAAGWQLRGEQITRSGLCMDALCAHAKRLRAGDAWNRFQDDNTEPSVQMTSASMEVHTPPWNLCVLDCASVHQLYAHAAWYGFMARQG